jgi:hypothetical protein
MRETFTSGYVGRAPGNRRLCPEADEVALKYKELWRVEKVFRDIKSLLDTRPIFHKRVATIRGHVFCSFLALVLRKELDRRLLQAGHRFEWAAIKQDLKALQQANIEEDGQTPFYPRPKKKRLWKDFQGGRGCHAACHTGGVNVARNCKR